jgi:hypothetical protein
VKPDFYLFTREIIKGIRAIVLIEKKTKTCSLISLDYSTQISFKKKKKKKKKQAVLEGSTKNLKIFVSYDREIADLTN